MRVVWILLLAVLRPLYFVYALFCWLAMPLTLLVLPWMIAGWTQPADLPTTFSAQVARVVAVLMGIAAAMLVSIVYIRRDKRDPNPWQSAFMSWFASLKWYWNDQPAPMVRAGLPSGFLVENPKSYRLTAHNMRELLALLQPGDILLRGYDGYLDGAAIRRSSRCAGHSYRPGWFTHAALYMGEIGDREIDLVPKTVRHNTQYIQRGPQMVLHSMAMGVHSEDILTWMRCDYMAVLRAKPDLTKRRDIALTDNGAERNDLQSVSGCRQIRAALNQGSPVNLDDVIGNVRESALEMVGEPYDFQCIVTEKFTRFSCAEYVYYCYRSIHDALGLAPQMHGLYPLGRMLRHFAILPRMTVTPDDYYALGKNGHLETVWVDPHSRHNA